MMSPDLVPYTDIIHSLTPLVNQSNFDVELKRRTQRLSNETRFLIKMEAKRLAKPCIRVIDFRSKVKDECRLYSFQGIEHFLHLNGILHFEKLIKRYGLYNFAVYGGMQDFAISEKQRFEQQALIPAMAHSEISLPQQQYVTACQALLNYPVRIEERLNYVTPIELFFEDNTSVHATTLDISINGLKIRLKEASELKLLKAQQRVSIIFRSADRDSKINKTPFSYHVLGVSGSHVKTQIHLKRADAPMMTNDPSRSTVQSGHLLDAYISQLLSLYKRRYKVNLDNVEMAVSSKIYEQSFANNTPTLPVFIETDAQGKAQARYVSTNSNSAQILEYWETEKMELVLGYLVNQERITVLAQDDSPHASMLVYCFNHVKDNKVYFYSASQQELESQMALMDTFLAYGARKVSWRVYKLTFSDVVAGQGINPSSVPDGISKDIDALNRPPSPRLQGRLCAITSMISVSDITDQHAQESYQKRALKKDFIKRLSVFGHPRNKPPLAIDSFRHKATELRRQTRYVLRTSVLVKTSLHVIEGVTEDVSVSGLKLELNEPYMHRLHSKVQVSFVKLQGLTQDFELTNLHYRVKHSSADKHILHLEAVSEDENSIAEQFFAELIDSNIDRLPAINTEESMPGMSHALRAIHARASTQFCAYVEKKPQGFLPSMTTLNPPRAQWMQILDNQHDSTATDLSWLYQDDTLPEPFVKQALKLLRIDPKPISTEIYLACKVDKTGRVSQINARWHYQLRTHHAKQQFMQKAKHNGAFYAFKVTINKALKPDLEKVEHELFYLGQYAIHKATHFEEKMWDIAGCIFLTEISDEVRMRYQ
ncbi:PilZ domain-containing protein [Ningiella sp. W23]|uniref:PilZ domain-containing protein n=1 Tax=Ningiella sp. W23 TaxID=3023715 RepID=UPI003757BA23